MKIYITGDVHGDLRRFQPEIFYEQESLTKKDVVLVCGDLGCVWYGDERDAEGLDWLEGGNVRRIRPSVILLEHGQIFSLAGKRFFTMGGASSHDI